MQAKFKEAMAEARFDSWNASFDYYLEKVKAVTKEFFNKHSVTFDILKGQVILSPVEDSKKEDSDKKEPDTKKPDDKKK